MKIDHLSSCNQPQTGGVGGQDAFVSAKKRAELPKDVLEALEEGDLEEALFLLRQHQQGSASEGIFPDWILFRTLNNIYSALMNMLSAPKKKPLPPKKKVGKKEVEIKQAPSLNVRIKLSLKQLAATLAAYSLAAEKTVSNTAKALA
ncbi:MAG: hypothetical protein KDK48_04745, partial [Chlamydiia bacterium]|nr:hypothetical protein [Chlamydiia bacterium]